MGHKNDIGAFWSLSGDRLLILYFLCVVLVVLISITLRFVLYRQEVVGLNSGCILVLTTCTMKL